MGITFLIIWIIVGFVCGVYICKSYKAKVDTLCEIGEICTALEENISHFKRPTSEFLAAYPFKTPNSDILLSQNEKSNKKTATTEVNDFKALLLEIETCETITAKSKLQAFAKRNKEKLEKAEKEYKQKGETSKKLGMLFGLLMGILWL